MPGRLGFTQGEWVQVLALHSLEQKSYNKCPKCMNDDKHVVRECFYCGTEYTNADSSRDYDSGAPADRGGNESMRNAVDAFLGGKPGASTAAGMARERASGDKSQDEQRAEARAKFAETLKQGERNGN